MHFHQMLYIASVSYTHLVNVITMLKELSDIVIHNNRLEKNIDWIIWIKNL